MYNILGSYLNGNTKYQHYTEVYMGFRTWVLKSINAWPHTLLAEIKCIEKEIYTERNIFWGKYFPKIIVGS